MRVKHVTEFLVYRPGINDVIWVEQGKLEAEDTLVADAVFPYTTDYQSRTLVVMEEDDGTGDV